ncbi:protoporphyrinogen oxidase [Colletotrichum plurivorum]|uniref:Protoporphyrinogen oxidase n=1 Tax=Colletotrichum plurivorum TaxID=2175906 RepID=A0A8H6U5I5_9PEZI|nr:protoporphyrinogen oxidase [Colletotrichum plurivorum]
MVLKRPEDAFMALLRSYHSRQFCRVAIGARTGVAASRFSTSAQLAASPRRKKEKEQKELLPWEKERAPLTFVNAIDVPKNVAIIGSGITGLTTAHYLARWLPKSSQITIFDSAERTGGWINTETYNPVVDGKEYKVRFERGPRTLRGMGKDTWKFDDFILWDIIRELDMFASYSGMPSPPRYIYHKDRLVRLSPWNLLVHPIFKGAIIGLLTALNRRKEARANLVPPDMSVSDFVKYATGRPELTDNLVSAMLHGIWGGDADKLSMPSAMPSLWHRYFDNSLRDSDRLTRVLVSMNEVTLGSTLCEDKFLQSCVKIAQKDQLVFFKDGMTSLPNAIEGDLRKRQNVVFRLGNPIETLRYDFEEKKPMVKPRGSEPMHFDKVISTTTSKALYQMTMGALPHLQDSPHVSIMAVNVWYPKSDLNRNYPGVGYLVPGSVEDNPEHLLGVFFDSDVVPRAEDESKGTKFFVLMGGHHYDNRPDAPTEEEGIEMAKAVLERHLGIPRDEPCFAVAHYAKDCIPQHHVGHWARMGLAASEIDYAFKGSLAVAGGSYTSIGVMGGIRAGHDVAWHIAKSALGHVGNTGLEQFQASVSQETSVKRSTLARFGRDISPKAGWLKKIEHMIWG